MPVLAGAGRNPSVTFLPLCKPTPVTLTELFKVRCLTIAVLITEIIVEFYHRPEQDWGARTEMCRLG